jgi:hypothetical protein
MRLAMWACVALAVAACDDSFGTVREDAGTQETQPQGPLCGDQGLRCGTGSICLFRDTSVAGQPQTGIFECVADPCPGLVTLDCSCAAAVCGPGAFCEIQAPRQMLCRNTP